MEWAEETIVRLRTLWDEGLSTAEIGRRLGVSKNAVVGKAHRLDLPARPSPIRRDGSGPACAATVGAAAGRRTDIAAAIEHRRDGRRRWRTDGSAADDAGAAQADPGAAARPCGVASAPALWPDRHLLLADRGAGHTELPVLRRGIGAGQAILLGSREAGLCAGARSARRRRLTGCCVTVYSLAASRIARGVAAMSWSCVAGRSARMKP